MLTDASDRTDLATRIGRAARRPLSRVPWTSTVGLARTVLALGTLSTLLATSPQVLLAPLAGGITPPTCASAGRFGLWCVLPQAHGQTARWVSVLILLLVASGWRPRLTALPHWWVSWSLTANITIQDGGDQVTAVLTFLLLPVVLTDPRRWHWSTPDGGPAGTVRVIAHTGLVLVKLQVAGLYFQAGIAKLGVAEWADGTAMWYWFRHPVFGAPGWLRPVTSAITGSGTAVALLTWGSIALEVALALALLAPMPVRKALLAAGLAFHDGIALTMGLVSFDVAMSAALVLYLLPIGHRIHRPPWLATILRRTWFLGTRAGPEAVTGD